MHWPVHFRAPPAAISVAPITAVAFSFSFSFFSSYSSTFLHLLSLSVLYWLLQTYNGSLLHWMFLYCNTNIWNTSFRMNIYFTHSLCDKLDLHSLLFTQFFFQKVVNLSTDNNWKLLLFTYRSVSRWTEAYQGEQKCIKQKCIKVNRSVSRWTEVYQGEQNCIKVNRSVSRWTEVYQGEQKCIKVNRSVSRWTEVYQGKQKRIKVNRSVSRWTEVYQGEQKRIKANRSVSRWTEVNQGKQKHIKVNRSVSRWLCIVSDNMNSSAEPPSWIWLNRKKLHSIHRPRKHWARAKHGVDW